MDSPTFSWTAESEDCEVSTEYILDQPHDTDDDLLLVTVVWDMRASTLGKGSIKKTFLMEFSIRGGSPIFHNFMVEKNVIAGYPP